MISLARPGIGVAYRGTIKNSDYRFSSTIPRGLVGWGGVYRDAPFHGFVIYLNDKATSCMLFEISIRVDLDEDTRGDPPLDSKPVQFGNRMGLQSSTAGDVAGVGLENVSVTYEYPVDGEKIDVGVMLVAPMTEDKKSKAALAQFLASFRFP